MLETRRVHWFALIPVLVLILVAGDKAAFRAIGHDHDHGDHAHGIDLLDPSSRKPYYWFPALRAFMFHLWTLRIHAAKRSGHLSRALRHAREALAIAPDLPLARSQLASVLAWDLAASEADERRRLAWMAEGLAILDEGLDRDPYDAQLHNMRAMLLYNRGQFSPAFEEAFVAMHGRTTLDEATDAMLRAAELGRGTMSFIRGATILLLRRGDLHLDRALSGEVDALADAERDIARVIEMLERLLEQSNRGRAERLVDLGAARVNEELCDLLIRAVAGEEVSEERIRELIELRDAGG